MVTEAKKPSILYVITKSNWGGAQKYVYDLATSLKNDAVVKVALGGNGTLAQKLNKVAIPVFTISGLKRDMSIFGDFVAFFSLLKIVWKERPSVLHLNSSKIGGIGALIGRLCRVKNIVYTIHGLPFNEDRPKYWKFLARSATWLSVILCHKIILLSETEKEQVQKWIGAKGKCFVVENGIRPYELVPRHIARTELMPHMSEEERKDKICIVTIAELHKNKGLEYAIDAIHKINNPNILYIVMGEGEKRKQLESQIEKLQEKSRIKLLGHVSDAPTLLSGADIFLFPSVKEGFPYALLEAGLASLPVVASHVGGIPRIIEDMICGALVRPKNPKEIASALSYLIEKSEKRVGYGFALRKKVSSLYTIERMVSETLDVYGFKRVVIHKT